MHLFFQQNPFRADAASDLQNDAKLALHLVLFLLSTQNLDDGTWGGVHTGAKLRNTAHALEALHMLGWEGTVGTVEAGIAWLINLPDLFGFEGGEEDLIRLNPSRFKTLAWLGEFRTAQLRKDFEDLEEHLDEDGLLRGIMAKQLLATIVYVDCLHYLDQEKLLSLYSQERWMRALDCIEHHVSLWYQDQQQKTQHSHISTPNAGDLSYAIDLLFRAGKLSRQDEISNDILVELISELKRSKNSDPMKSDTLYCAIQLVSHFPEVTRAREAVRNLIHHLAIRYERQTLRREPSFFHPLVLRLLLTYHGDRLKAEMTRLLLDHEWQNLELRRQSEEQSLKDDLGALIKSRFEVAISEVQRLTGGMTSAEIFRVHFSLKLSSVNEGQEVEINTYHPSPGSLVIKNGSLDSLRRSIQRYQSLPNILKPYFAKHAGEPQVLEVTSGATGYLIMEDLTYMKTFHSFITRLDRGILSRTQAEDLNRACDIICTRLFAIYDQTKRSDTDFFGPQLSRIYISAMEKSLIGMCRVNKFPHLKSWFRGFWLGERKYLSIEYYLRKIESHGAKLKVPYLMLIHGDCHSRNIMLDDPLHQLKLIDLDHLDEDGDYIMDHARLIEDVSILGFLLDDGYRFHLHNSQIHFPSDSDKPKVIENKIKYPPFSSEAVRLFQQNMLQNLELYAQAINDKFWKKRLWLALATNLMFLVSKQTEKGYGTVVYVEAVKLLDELVSCLDKGVPLADIPFPDKHPTGVDREVGRDALTLPSWYQESSILTDVHDGMIDLDPAVKYELTSSGRVAQYFATNSQRLFAVIDGKKQPPSVLLACLPQALDDPLGMAQERKTGSALQTILPISENNEVSAVVELVQQVFELNR
jgi:hypothetical protein